MPGSAATWTSCPLPCRGATLRLFCIPYAGAGASVFRDWPDEMTPEIEVWPVHAPGRERRLGEPPMRSIRSLAAGAAAGLAPHLDQPYAIFGHSMGALIGFELARALRRARQRPPQALLVSGFGGPHLTSRRSPIHPLADEQFKDAVRALNGTPSDVIANDELMDLLLPLLRADFQAVETYSHSEEPPFEVPIFVYSGRDDFETPEEDLAEWSRHTSAECRVTLFEGDHFYLRRCGPALRRQVRSDLLELGARPLPRDKDN